MIRILFIGVVAALAATGAAQAQSPARAGSPVEARQADRIVAVVNNEVITRLELRQRLDTAVAQLRRQGTELPSMAVLEQQMLERMILERAQLLFAVENGLKVDDGQLDQALRRIASNNNLTAQQFRAALERDGIAYNRFREDIRQEITLAQLREREVDNKIVVSDGEIDNFLANEALQGGSGATEYALAHVLVRLPEGATPEQISERRARIEGALAALKAGKSFAEVAANFSDAQDALSGGLIPPRPLDRLPTLYAEAVTVLEAGQLTPILRSPNGFHLVKLVAKRDAGTDLPPVQQTHARHILIRIGELVSEAEAKHKMQGLRDRLIHGEKFEELARLFSQDGSGAKGGDLGWLYPGDTVPDFERAMDALAIGEFSEPVRSPFGMHLIQVLERRVQDVSDERRRLVARQALRERKSEDAYQDWLRQLRDRTYVEVRLEERE